MKTTDPFFVCYLTVVALAGAWGVYFCLSPLYPAPTSKEILAAVVIPVLTLGGLFMERHLDQR